MKIKDRRGFRGNELMIAKVLEAADAAPCYTNQLSSNQQAKKQAAAQAKRERKAAKRLK